MTTTPTTLPNIFWTTAKLNWMVKMVASEDGGQ